MHFDIESPQLLVVGEGVAEGNGRAPHELLAVKRAAAVLYRKDGWRNQIL
jgi:hypothetical protein